MFIAPVVLTNRRARLRAKEYFAPLELATILYGGSINIFAAKRLASLVSAFSARNTNQIKRRAVARH